MSNGHRLDDIKYLYTIDQVYLFVEKCRKIEMDTQKINALSLVHSISYASPRFSDDKKIAGQRRKTWNNFIDSLTWEKVTRKAKKTVGDFTNMFKNAGVVIKNSKRESDTNG